MLLAHRVDDRWRTWAGRWQADGQQIVVIVQQPAEPRDAFLQRVSDRMAKLSHTGGPSYRCVALLAS